MPCPALAILRPGQQVVDHPRKCRFAGVGQKGVQLGRGRRQPNQVEIHPGAATWPGKPAAPGFRPASFNPANNERVDRIAPPNRGRQPPALRACAAAENDQWLAYVRLELSSTVRLVAQRRQRRENRPPAASRSRSGCQRASTSEKKPSGTPFLGGRARWAANPPIIANRGPNCQSAGGRGTALRKRPICLRDRYRLGRFARRSHRSTFPASQARRWRSTLDRFPCRTFRPPARYPGRQPLHTVVINSGRSAKRSRQGALQDIVVLALQGDPNRVAQLPQRNRQSARSSPRRQGTQARKVAAPCASA